MLNIKQLHRFTLTSWGTSNWTTYAGGYFYYTKNKVRYSIKAEGYDTIAYMKTAEGTALSSAKKFVNPLIFIDGKEASNISELKMDYVTDTSYDDSPIARLKYGDKAKNGVIYIYTAAHKK